MSKDQATETLQSMHNVGGHCPLIPMQTPFDREAKGLAVEAGKNAALEAAYGSVNGPCRMAWRTKRGPGWTVDGKIDGGDIGGESQNGSSGNRYAYQHWVSHHGGDVNEAARMYMHYTMVVRVPPMNPHPGT